jgi:signal peptidase I
MVEGDPGETITHEPADGPAQDEPPPSTKGRGRRGGVGCAVEIVETLALTLVVFFVIQNFVAQPFQVEQRSMERTFLQGDYVLVDRLSALWRPYSRGQVVVFQPPPILAPEKDPFIKRVIGVAGDTVEIRNGRVYVNDVVLDEPYLFRNAENVAEATLAPGQGRWLVPRGQLFVMGDHRQVSVDSRVFGPIAVSSVIGRGVLRYWPLASFGLIDTPAYTGLPAP